VGRESSPPRFTIHDPRRCLYLDWYDSWLITIKVSPMFDPLRTHPRFERILRKVNLAD
jgi:hypothetical protein